MDLNGKVAVILGASAGIGESLAEAVAGAHPKALVVSARSRAKLQTLADRLHQAHGVETLALPIDATDHEQIKLLIDRTVAEYGALDILCYTAGMIETPTPLDRATPEFRQRIFAVNVLAPLNAAHLVLPVFKRQGRGTFLALSSHAARRSFPDEEDYHATKAALSHGIRSWDVSLQPYRAAGSAIYAFAIEPGFIDTEEARKQFPDLIGLIATAPTPAALAQSVLLPHLVDPEHAYREHGPVRLYETV